jgi:hypothetical protein
VVVGRFLGRRVGTMVIIDIFANITKIQVGPKCYQ